MKEGLVGSRRVVKGERGAGWERERAEKGGKVDDCTLRGDLCPLLNIHVMIVYRPVSWRKRKRDFRFSTRRFLSATLPVSFPRLLDVRSTRRRL